MSHPRFKFTKIALALLALTLIISVFGLLFVFEASTAESYLLVGHPYHFVSNQSWWLLLGFCLMMTVIFLPLKIWRHLAVPIYILSLLLLVLVFVPGIGREFNGARRWFDFFGITLVQPVEIAKLALILFFASWMSKEPKLGPFLFLTLLPVTLLLLQPDLGSALVLICIAFALFFLAGAKIWQILGVGIIGIMAIMLVIIFSPYRRQRLMTYLNPSADPLGAGFHSRQITLALGRGALWGQGLGQSAQKYKYIPEASSDSIMAIVAEELGFIGSSVIIILYLIYFLLMLKVVARQRENKFNYLLAAGILFWFASQTILNLSAIVALLPLTGIPLPLFSYGGSSLLMLLLGTGIMIKISCINKK